jgi:tetratricopeptide (TPR) repeat protein
MDENSQGARGEKWVKDFANRYGRLHQAKINYERSLQFDANNADTLSNLSQVCEDLREVECAESIYKRLFELDPNSAEGRYNLGNFYDDQGVHFDQIAGRVVLNSQQIDKAIIQYQQAIAPDGAIAVNALNNLSRLRIFQGDFKNAEVTAKEGLTKTADPEMLSALNKNLGWALFKQNRLNEAHTALKTSTTLDPFRKEAFCLKGQVLDIQGSAEYSKQMWEECFSTHGQEEISPEVLEWRHQKLLKLLGQSAGTGNPRP